jgi:hypothetical protein
MKGQIVILQANEYLLMGDLRWVIYSQLIIRHFQMPMVKRKSHSYIVEKSEAEIHFSK